MKEEKKILPVEETEEVELELDDLDQVSGGSLRNVRFTQTVDISEDTISKVCGTGN